MLIIVGMERKVFFFIINVMNSNTINNNSISIQSKTKRGAKAAKTDRYISRIIYKI
jgi:hypothetical protein